MNKVFKVGLWIILIIYLLILSKLILFKYIGGNEIIKYLTFKGEVMFFLNQKNFIPFKTIGSYMFGQDSPGVIIAFKNLAGNMIGFVPFGIMLPLLFEKARNIRTVFFATLILSLTFELIQLVFKFGIFDVDDLLLNTLGGVVGYLLTRIFIDGPFKTLI